MQEELQKTTEEKCCCQNGRTESESYGGAQTYIWMVYDNLVEVQLVNGDMFERILSSDNLFAACKRVVRNNKSGGVDKMVTSEQLPYLNLRQAELL